MDNRRPAEYTHNQPWTGYDVGLNHQQGDLGYVNQMMQDNRHGYYTDRTTGQSAMFDSRSTAQFYQGQHGSQGFHQPIWQSQNGDLTNTPNSYVQQTYPSYPQNTFFDGHSGGHLPYVGYERYSNVGGAPSHLTHSVPLDRYTAHSGQAGWNNDGLNRDTSWQSPMQDSRHSTISSSNERPMNAVLPQAPQASVQRAPAPNCPSGVTHAQTGCISLPSSTANPTIFSNNLLPPCSQQNKNVVHSMPKLQELNQSVVSHAVKGRGPVAQSNSELSLNPQNEKYSSTHGREIITETKRSQVEKDIVERPAPDRTVLGDDEHKLIRQESLDQSHRFLESQAEHKNSRTHSPNKSVPEDDKRKSISEKSTHQSDSIRETLAKQNNSQTLPDAQSRMEKTMIPEKTPSAEKHEHDRQIRLLDDSQPPSGVSEGDKARTVLSDSPVSSKPDSGDTFHKLTDETRTIDSNLSQQNTISLPKHCTNNLNVNKSTESSPSLTTVRTTLDLSAREEGCSTVVKFQDGTRQFIMEEPIRNSSDKAFYCHRQKDGSHVFESKMESASKNNAPGSPGNHHSPINNPELQNQQHLIAVDYINDVEKRREVELEVTEDCSRIPSSAGQSKDVSDASNLDAVSLKTDGLDQLKRDEGWKVESSKQDGRISSRFSVPAGEFNEGMFDRCPLCDELVPSNDMIEHPYKCKAKTHDQPAVTGADVPAHDDDAAHNCPECGVGFQTMDDLVIHLRIHDMLAKNAQKMQEENQMMAMTEQLGQQMADLGDLTGEPEECEVCCETFTDPTMIPYHNMMHQQFPFHCRKCNLFFPTLNDLYKTRCNDQKRHKVFKYRCKKCKGVISDSFKMRKHRKRCEGKMEICRLCKKKFPSFKQLAAHVEVCNEVVKDDDEEENEADDDETDKALPENEATAPNDGDQQDSDSQNEDDAAVGDKMVGHENKNHESLFNTTSHSKVIDPLPIDLDKGKIDSTINLDTSANTPNDADSKQCFSQDKSIAQGDDRSCSIKDVKETGKTSPPSEVDSTIMRCKVCEKELSQRYHGRACKETPKYCKACLKIMSTKKAAPADESSSLPNDSHHKRMLPIDDLTANDETCRTAVKEPAKKKPKIGQDGGEICGACGKWFKNFDKLVKHAQKCDGVENQQDRGIFVEPPKASNEINLDWKYPTKYQCQGCDKKFAKKKKYKKHVKACGWIQDNAPAVSIGGSVSTAELSLTSSDHLDPTVASVSSMQLDIASVTNVESSIVSVVSAESSAASVGHPKPNTSSASHMELGKADAASVESNICTIASVDTAESSVATVAPRESSEAPFAPSVLNVAPIAESSVASVAPGLSSTAPIALREVSVTPVAPGESTGAPIVHAESSVASVAPEESGTAPIAPAEPSVASFDPRESGVASTAHVESSVDPISSAVSNVAPVPPEESREASVSTKKSSIVPIALEESSESVVVPGKSSVAGELGLSSVPFAETSVSSVVPSESSAASAAPVESNAGTVAPQDSSAAPIASLHDVTQSGDGLPLASPRTLNDAGAEFSATITSEKITEPVINRIDRNSKEDMASRTPTILKQTDKGESGNNVCNMLDKTLKDVNAQVPVSSECVSSIGKVSSPTEYAKMEGNLFHVENVSRTSCAGLNDLAAKEKNITLEISCGVGGNAHSQNLVSEMKTLRTGKGEEKGLSSNTSDEGTDQEMVEAGEIDIASSPSRIAASTQRDTDPRSIVSHSTSQQQEAHKDLSGTLPSFSFSSAATKQAVPLNNGVMQRAELDRTGSDSTALAADVGNAGVNETSSASPMPVGGTGEPEVLLSDNKQPGPMEVTNDIEKEGIEMLPTENKILRLSQQSEAEQGDETVVHVAAPVADECKEYPSNLSEVGEKRKRSVPEPSSSMHGVNKVVVSAHPDQGTSSTFHEGVTNAPQASIEAIPVGKNSQFSGLKEDISMDSSEEMGNFVGSGDTNNATLGHETVPGHHCVYCAAEFSSRIDLWKHARGCRDNHLMVIQSSVAGGENEYQLVEKPVNLGNVPWRVNNDYTKKEAMVMKTEIGIDLNCVLPVLGYRAPPNKPESSADRRERKKEKKRSRERERMRRERHRVLKQERRIRVKLREKESKGPSGQNIGEEKGTPSAAPIRTIENVGINLSKMKYKGMKRREEDIGVDLGTVDYRQKTAESKKKKKKDKTLDKEEKEREKQRKIERKKRRKRERDREMQHVQAKLQQMEQNAMKRSKGSQPSEILNCEPGNQSSDSKDKFEKQKVKQDSSSKLHEKSLTLCVKKLNIDDIDHHKYSKPTQPSNISIVKGETSEIEHSKECNNQLNIAKKSKKSKSKKRSRNEMKDYVDVMCSEDSDRVISQAVSKNKSTLSDSLAGQSNFNHTPYTPHHVKEDKKKEKKKKKSRHNEEMNKNPDSVNESERSETFKFPDPSSERSWGKSRKTTWKQSEIGVQFPVVIEVECPDCGMTFSHQSTLDRHSRLHKT